MAASDLFHLLYGDGFFEVVAKSSPDSSELSTHARAKREKRQAQVGLASNALGIAAGAQALYSSGHALKDKLNEGKPKPKHRKESAPKSSKVPDIAGMKGRLKPAKKGLLKNPKTGLWLAGGMVGLQAANLGGDLVANRVLSREAKKDVKKNLPPLTPEGYARKKLHDRETEGLPLGLRGQLVRVSIKNREKIQPVVETGVEAGKKATARGVEVAGPKVKKAKEKLISKADDMSLTTEISKVDTDKRQIFGWASIVEKDGVPVVDLQGDYISVEEVEKAAYEYVQKSRKGGNQHQRNGDEPLHVSDMIESFVFTPEKKEKLGLPESVPTGWWVGFQIHDDETWDQIKSGKRPQLSIHGRGKRQEI